MNVFTEHIVKKLKICLFKMLRKKDSLQNSVSQPFLISGTFPYYFFQLLNEPGLCAGIDPNMAFTPFPSTIGWDLNPQSFRCESTTLTTRPDFCPGCFFLFAAEPNKIFRMCFALVLQLSLLIIRSIFYCNFLSTTWGYKRVDSW